MAVQVHLANGEAVTASVDSWTRCETICENILMEKGAAECHGWTLMLDNDEDEKNGLDYVLDVISELELPPAFPIQKQQTLINPKNEPMARRPTVPPPQPPTGPIHSKVRSISRDHSVEMGLSRQSALNDRYFDKPGRSRSLDNLLSPITLTNGPSKLETLGLSNSRLNERYHSMERIQETVADVELSKTDDENIENMESVSQRGENRKYSLTGASSDVGQSNNLDFDFPDMSARSEDDKGSDLRGHPRFIKSQYAGKRAMPGSHSSRAQIETRLSDKDGGVKSSAMSDTSEAPSLASHVRRVRVPSQASDVDQFLDDLFSPVLDQLSDARSLAASIKGGQSDVLEHIFDPLFPNIDFKPGELSTSIKGGGRTVGGVQQSQNQSGAFNFSPIGSPPMSGLISPPPLLVPTMPMYNQNSGNTSLGYQMDGSQTSGFVPVPIYNMQGMSLPSQNGGGSVEQNVIAYQASVQQAFLQSAMAQNIQIQQQLLAQNQALQQLLQQRVSTTEQPQWGSSPPKARSTSTPTRAQPHQNGTPQSAFTSVLSELKSRKSSTDSTAKSVVPPPPPMPPPPELGDPSETRPFMDPYGRAKTVRIGKWRWPPPKDDNSDTSFLQFKMKQRRKHSQEHSSDLQDGIEWEEFDLASEQSSIPAVPPKSPENQQIQYKSLDTTLTKPSAAGSIGKLRISNEMKHKLELVTANHSLRSTNKTTSRPSANKLDSDRRLLLQQQLAGRWGSVDSVDARNGVKEEHPSIVRSQVEKMEKTSPGQGWQKPPPPVIPQNQQMHSPHTHAPSRSSSFYSHNNPVPPTPIQPVTRDYTDQNMFSPVPSTHHSDHVEMEEFSEFPGAVDPLPSFHHLPEAQVATKHHQLSTNTHLTYNRVAWKLNIRKEVFSPKESVSSPLVLHLIFCQIVQDVLVRPIARISSEERMDMVQLLDQYGVTPSNMYSNQHKANTKRAVLDLARHWATYFARIFYISGGYQLPEVSLLAIAHSGIRLGRQTNNQIQVVHSIALDEITEINVGKGGSSIILGLQSGEKYPIYSNRSRQILAMVNAFLREAMPQNRVREERLRSVEKKGWLADARLTTPSPNTQQQAVQDDGKHSLLQFAILHFRQSPEKFEMLKTPNGEIDGSLKLVNHKKGSDWTWKEQVDLVKYSPTPIQESLLKLDPELNQLAVECFECSMRYMGDLPTTPEMTEVKCVYTILMHCHKYDALRDEVYCQLMKQTTNNKSDSCQRGWRLLSIIAAYFTCSETLRPFLLKYLESAAYDKRRAFHGTANVCLQNLRKTLRYGGRKNVPSVEEVTAVSAGRNSKRQLYRLPGGSETVVNTKSTTVVEDVIIEMCALINVTNPLEMEEFSLYCIVEGDAFTMPLAREEYILDVTTELHKNQQVFYLIFCRSVWHFPLRLDCQLYVQVLFNQIAPDYLEGLLLVLPNEQLPQDIIYDVAKLAALLHRAADMSHPPTMKETKFLLPKPALTQRDIKPAQWVQMVQANWSQIQSLLSIQAKAQLLELLSKWPLFGSSFFAIKRGGDQQILALNRNGVHFLHLITHETLSNVPYNEVISTRKVRAESGTLYLELKCGNLFQQRVARLQTDQAHEIARLIRQYMSLYRQKVGMINK